MPFPDLWPDKVAAYQSSAVCPADFAAFWAGTLAEVRSAPLNARFTPVDVGLAVFDIFDVSFAGWGGHEVRGWFIVPKGGARDCVVKYIGYNGGRGFAHEHLFWPATGRAVLVMDTRGQGAGWAVGATRDPYLEIARYLAVHRDQVERALHTLSYFDGVHFAARATAPALFSVALMDTICPPSSVYGAFNAYKGPKEIAVYTYNDHEGGGPFQEQRQREWLAGR